MSTLNEKNLVQKDFKVFDIFSNQWALATAGTPDNFNSCTIGWGSLGNIWSRDGSVGPIVTVYIYPSRYTCEYMKAHNTFTVSFFPEEYHKALGYMGSHSGRDGDKAKAAGLTPVAIGDSVTYEEASLTFLCKKLYQHEFDKKDLAQEICDYYKDGPRKVYPLDENGDWQTHIMFVGQIIDEVDKR